MITGYPLCRVRIPLSITDYKQHKLNTIYHYYDTLAFSNNKYNYINNLNTCLINDCIHCKNHRKYHNIEILEDDLIKDGDILKVKSVFGSMGMIPTHIYNKVNWTSDEVCEHYGFCKELTKFGDIIFDSNIKYIKSKERYLILNDNYVIKYDNLSQMSYYYNETIEETQYY
jgi:hypothetical protein